MVRPWKPPSAATTWVRPVRRVSLNAASLASVPELVKNTFAGPAPDQRRRASRRARPAAGLVKKLEMWPRVCSCSVTAATRAGWPCPSALTAMPPSRSTYSLPSSSQTWAPSPRTRVSFGGPKVFIRLAAYRSWKRARRSGHSSVPGLPGLGLDAGQHLGADALLGEQLDEHGVRLAAVDHRRPGYAAAHGGQAGAHLGDHARVEGGQHALQGVGADLADDVLHVGPVQEQALDVGEHEQLLGARARRPARPPRSRR